MSFVTERDVEQHFTAQGEAYGAWTVKLNCPGNAGMPDRLIIFPDGEIVFVEIKAPGKKPRPLQERMFARLEKRGHPVTVIDSLEEADFFWEVVDGHELMIEQSRSVANAPARLRKGTVWEDKE